MWGSQFCSSSSASEATYSSHASDESPLSILKTLSGFEPEDGLEFSWSSDHSSTGDSIGTTESFVSAGSRASVARVRKTPIKVTNPTNLQRLSYKEVHYQRYWRYQAPVVFAQQPDMEESRESTFIKVERNEIELSEESYN